MEELAMSRNELERMINISKPVVCECCNGKMVYVHGGMYRCEKCGNEDLDDFGKVKTFLDANGLASAFVISVATGVGSSGVGTTGSAVATGVKSVTGKAVAFSLKAKIVIKVTVKIQKVKEMILQKRMRQTSCKR